MTQVLIFVEDPGAVNYVVGLQSELELICVNSTVFSSSAMLPYASAKQLHVEVLSSGYDVNKLLENMQPELILVGTSEDPDAVGLSLLRAARVRGIKNVGFIDAFANSDYRFKGRTEDSLGNAPEWLFVPDQWTKKEYVRLGFPRKNIHITGHPHYDNVRAAIKKLESENVFALRNKYAPSAAVDDLVMVLVAEPMGGLNPRQFEKSSEYTLHGRGTSNVRSNIVIEEFLNAVKTLPKVPYLVLRLHPKNSREDFEAYHHEFDFVSSGGSPTELIFTANAVVGMTSMLVFEAAIAGKPTLSILPREIEKNWLPSIRSGATKCATTRKSIVSELQRLLEREPTSNFSPMPVVEIDGSLRKVAGHLKELLLI